MDRYDRLQPAAIIASIKSMQRRWKDAVHVSADKNIEDYFAIETDDGSIAEHIGAAITQLRTLRPALRTTAYNNPEPLDSEVAAAAANLGSGPWPSSTRAGLDELFSELDAIAGELETINTQDWNKTTNAGSTSLTLLQIAQGTSRVAANRLAIVERLVRQLADD